MHTLNSNLLRLLALLICALTIGCAQTEARNTSRAGIHQVGLVWLKKPKDAESRQKIIDAVHNFARSIPEVKTAVAGVSGDGVEGPFSDASYDVCFILTFADEDSRRRYNEHPVHQKAAREVFLPLSKKLLFYRFVGQ